MIRRTFFACAFAALGFATAAPAQVEIVSGSGPIAVNPVTNRIYVGRGTTLVEIDGATGAQRSVPVPSLTVGPGSFKGSALAIDPIHNRIYATHPALDQISVIDGRTLAVQTLAGGGGNWLFASAAALDPGRDLAWVVNRDASISRIHGDTLAVDPVDVGDFQVSNPVVDPIAGKVYATLDPGDFGETEGSVAVIDEETLAASVPPAFLVVPSAIAVDPLAARLLIEQGGTDNFLTYAFDAATFAELGTGFLHAGDYGGELSADPAFDRVWSAVGEDGCGHLGAFAGPSLVLIPETVFLACGSAIANPATNMAYAVKALGQGPSGPFEVAIKDASNLSAAVPIALPDAFVSGLRGDAATLAVNVANNRVYVATAKGADGVVFQIDEPKRRPVPMPTMLWNEPPQPNGSVVVHTSATTGWPLPVRQIYWQADAIDGAWSPSTPSGATATATVTLAPGAHEIHAFAVDGQEATLGEIQRRGPIVGPTTTLPVFVATTTPHVDIEVDSPWSERSLPRPGVFPFQLSLVNATGGPQTFAFLISLVVPGFGTMTLLPATGMQIPNGVGFAAAVHLPIEANLPAGTYTLGATLLQAGTGVVDQSVMTFTVQ